ncbi:hypothetical protein NL676_030768 [Syzygium grande]|nr:hypothetical protein NL676_030768 [Syzygium grande]
MAAAHAPLRLLHLLLLLISSTALSLLAPTSRSQTAPPPPPLSPPPPVINRYVLPVHKDGATSLHVANILRRTPQKPIPHLVDLNGGMVWEHCDERRYLSSTFYAPPFGDYFCSPAGKTRFSRTCPGSVVAPDRAGCHNNSCGIMAVNPVTKRTAVAELSIDMFSILTTRGSNPGRPIRFCKFYFACAPSSLLRSGLPANVHGVAGLGRTPISLQSQLASHCGFPPMFALCLTSVSSNDNRGVIFFGDGPYNMLPGSMINQKPVPLNTSLLGDGRTGISTTTPYTILEHSIFVALTRSFTSELSQIPQVEPIPPFPACYERSRLPSTRAGPGVPTIELILQDKNAVWTIFGANSMVEAPGDALPGFDVAGSRLGLSSSLLLRRTSCANFNFTSIAPQAE